jgi:type II secretory pathway pseudopilin PulG
MKPVRQLKSRSGLSAYTIPEVMLGVAVMAVMFVSLYMGFTQGFAVIQLARENLRATQILQEKMETIRLYTWEQINPAISPGFVPPTFTAHFYPAGGTNQGVVYNGTVTIGNAPLSESYAGDLKQVDVQVTWTSGNVQRSRTMQTLVSRYGLHNYIYDKN